MNPNKITFLQSLKLGAWWWLLNLVPTIVLGATMGVLSGFSFVLLFDITNQFYLKIYATIIFIVMFYIFLALNTYFFYKIFPVETGKFQIQFVKKIRFKRLFMYSIVMFAIYMAAHGLIELITPSPIDIEQSQYSGGSLMWVLWGRILLQLLLLTFSYLIIASFTAYLVINRNPDCFEVIPIDGDKEVVEGN